METKLILPALLFIFSIVFALILASAVLATIDCWQYSGTSQETCEDAGCIWQTQDEDPWCNDETGCCMMNGCWQHDGDQESCESDEDELNCTWDSYQSMQLPNGSWIYGMCFEDFSYGSWGGVAEGCWQHDGDYSSCTSAENAQSCSWSANNVNQNPWCWIKTLSDAQAQNPDATSTDIGCCEMKGCWNYNGNETMCLNNSALGDPTGGGNGTCGWVSSDNDAWCDDPVGCCMAKWCSEIVNASVCSKMYYDLYIPCEWDTENSVCQDSGGGGFTFYNDTDSCLSVGGWYNMTGACVMPTDTTGGGGGFMFAEEAHCWFADNQQDICQNITGCIYCKNINETYGNETRAFFNVSGAYSGTNNASSACYGHQTGLCQGHEWPWINWNGGNNFNVTDIATNNLNCSQIKIKSACEYGPLPNCIWQNSSTIIGSFCTAGTSSAKKSSPPVPFCDHPDARNNYTMCLDLKEKYLMPCKWANASINHTNCTFNSNAVFGITGEKDLETVTSESLCVAAGGTWNSEYYVEDGVLKQDSWCEKGAMYDYTTGSTYANKANCDNDCWACEFNASGSTYPSSGDAQANCTASILGYCRWTNDTNAPNGWGWCDYPNEMTYGAGDCQTSCKDCDLMSSPYASCLGSMAGCKWVNDTNATAILNTGICVQTSKKTCDDDCFSCYDFYACNSSSVDCQWDSATSLCKPAAYTGEICFDGIDNDGDMMVDCGDPDCSFATSCGGSTYGGCAQYTTPTTCAAGVAFEGRNCTWVNSTWEPVGHCGMPGENCWQYDYNLTLCNETEGCTNASSQGFAFCDVNITLERATDCGQHTTEEDCWTDADVCKWHTSEWGEAFCDYMIYDCYRHATNQDACEDDTNCTWNSFDNRCEVICHNMSLNSSDCEALSSIGLDGVCNWIDAGAMCMPEVFDVMAGGSGAKMGCAQYDGNQSGCVSHNYTCIWQNDSFVDNNLSADEIDGWCYPKSEYQMSGDMKGEISMLGEDTRDDDVSDFVDIEGFGMRVSNDAYGFGMKIVNLSEAAICNSYPLSSGLFGGGIGGGNKSTEFYWYLGTDGHLSGGHCDGIGEDSVPYGDFEFYIKYVVTNSTSGINTKKQLFKCTLNQTGGWAWAPTNVFISDNKKFTCFESGAAFVTIEKTGLENFKDLFNVTAPIRVMVASASIDSGGAGTSRTSPADGVAPTYYTPGTIDFGFVDCSNPDIKDSKCKSFQKFGFQSFEDCKNGIDDDSDGLADCADPKCAFTPACSTGAGTAFNFALDESDSKTPMVMFSKVDKMADAAIIMFDTDEPANGSLIFYNQSETCAYSNKTLSDLGDPLFEFDDYKPYHRISLNSDTLGTGLSNQTTYFYKVTVCDPSNNCGTSSCLNFTTKKENKNFIFRMDLPPGYNVTIPALNYSGNFTQGVGNKIYDIGIKTNSSQTTNMNISVNYGDLSLKLVGVDMYKPKTLDLETAFIADTDEEVLGMNSSSKSWNVMLNDLGLGGANDYIELEFPIPYSSSNSLKWYDDDMINESDVSSYSNCSGDDSETICKIPSTLGFSVYQISSPSGETGAAPGGGGGGGAAAWSRTYVIGYEQLKEGFSKQLKESERMKLEIGTAKEIHYVGVEEITSQVVKFIIESETIEAIIFENEKQEFDLTGDGWYDLLIRVDDISDDIQNADLWIQGIHEEVPQVEETVKEKVERVIKETVEEAKENYIWTIIIIVVVLLVVGGIIYKKKKK